MSGVWEVIKFSGRVAIVGVAGAAIASTGGLAAPVIGGLVYGGGKLVKTIGKECDCKFIEDLGDFTEDVGIDAFTCGMLKFGTKTFGQLAAKEIAKNGRKMTTTAKILINTGKTIKIGGKVYNIYGKGQEEIKRLYKYLHGYHKGEGNKI